MSLSSRPTFNLQQIQQIFDRLDLRPEHRHLPSDATQQLARDSDGLAWLSVLQRHHLAHIPFESLELHYSPTKVISLDPNVLFHKIITQNTGRGGYCMENNAFFGTLLRSLGFIVMDSGCRVSSAAGSDTYDGDVTFTGWSHMVNIVTLGGHRYLVDVGFGSGGPTHPLPLKDGSRSMNIAPSQWVGLRWGAIPQNENQEAKLWLFERKNGEGGWVTTYCFPDMVEFIPSDYAVMSHYTSTSRASFFTFTTICTKFILSDDQETIVGIDVLFGNKAHRRIRGEKQELGTFASEEERVEALKTHFGISLSPAQKAGIKGLSSAIG